MSNQSYKMRKEAKNNMDIDKYNKADKLLRAINWRKDKVQRINDFLRSGYDRVDGLVKNLVDESYYSRLNNAVDNKLKVYRDRLEKEIEQLKKEFEAL